MEDKDYYTVANGSLSTRKRSDHFHFLTGEELSDMEQAVKNDYNIAV